MDNSLMVVKVVILTIIGLTSIAFGCLPICLDRVFALKKWCTNPRKQKSFDDVKKFLLCFGGGVLFFTSFIHLHPEVRLTFSDLERQHIFQNAIEGLGVQTSELLICCGFFIVYVLEEAMHYAIDYPRDRNEFVIHRTVSVRQCAATTFAPCDNFNNINDNNNSGKMVECQLDNTSPPEESLPMECPISLFEPTTHSSPETHQAGLGQSSTSLLEQGCSSVSSIADGKNTHQPHHHWNDGSPTGIDTINGIETTKENLIDLMRGLITIFALSIHALFEGLALGLEESFSSVWYLFFAVGTHKFVIIFCVGMELLSAKLKPLTIFIYIVAFSAVTPIGILIGALICCGQTPADGRSDVLLIISAFLQAMAAGTLLYVIFFEILVRERDFNGRGFIQIFAIACGFLFMMGMHAIVSGHQHSHSHGHGHSHDHDEHIHEHDDHGHDHGEHEHVTKNSIDEQLRMLRDALDGLNHAVGGRRHD